MKKLMIPTKMSRAFNKVGFKFKKHSPEILVIAGVVGTVASTVMACKATTKVSGIIDEHKRQLDAVNMLSAEDRPEEYKNVEYTKDDRKRDLAIIYSQTGVQLFKLYAPAVALGAVSLTSIIASHKILRKRNVALAAAYATVDNSFKEYRGRVVERFGKELDRELKYNIKATEIEEVVVDKEGNETVVKTTVNTVEPNLNSDYARFFDEYCNGWTKDPEYNLVFLKQQQNWANERLRAKGHLYLNEVYDMLGIPRSQAGQIVGWIYDEKHPVGDNYVDFGIYDVHDKNKRLFVNGHERSILLDFNVDGNILELMK